MQKAAPWFRLQQALRPVSGGERGQAATEYVVVLALLVLGIGGLSLAALGTSLGNSLSDAVSRVATALRSVS
jgi:Flp pilus assembly pilin Flp